MRLTRFERATCRSAICCSIQLSYNLSFNPLYGMIMEFCLQNPSNKESRRIFYYGAGGIRTPGTLSGHNSLAGSPIRPLSHRSKETVFWTVHKKYITKL